MAQHSDPGPDSQKEAGGDQNVESAVSREEAATEGNGAGSPEKVAALPEEDAVLERQNSLDSLMTSSGSSYRLRTEAELRKVFPEQKQMQRWQAFSGAFQSGGFWSDITGTAGFRCSDLDIPAPGPSCTLKWLRSLFPILTWLPKWSWRRDLRSDLVAGIVIGIMLVPQGMAYGMLAGTPPIYGLYSSITPSLVYMLTGTARDLQLGTNAPISVLVAGSIEDALGSTVTCDEDELHPDCVKHIAAVQLVSIMAGILYAVMGLCQMGVVTAFVPDPVLSGFTTGASMIIITSNLKHFIGMEIPRDSLLNMWAHALQNLKDINPVCLTLGIIFLMCLFGIKDLNRRYKKKLPMPVPEQLVVLLVSIIGCYALDLSNPDKYKYPLSIVGDIPSGMQLTVPEVSMELIQKLIQPTIVVTLVTYILTVNVAKSMGNQKGYNVDANQEFFAYSLASIVGGLTGGQPPSGSFSRSALVGEIGAKSALHNLFSSFIVFIVVQFLTFTLKTLPKVVMAAIIYQALKNMIQFQQARFLWSVNRIEFGLWLTCFLSTSILGVTWGIAISMVAAILVLLKEQSRPSSCILGKLPGTEIYRNIKRFPQASEIEGIKIFRFDANIHFANKDHFEAALATALLPPKAADGTSTRCSFTQDDVHTVVLECSSMNSIDTSAVYMLKRTAQKFEKKGVRLYFASWKGHMRETLEKLGFHEHGVSDERMFLSLHDAVLAAYRRGHRINAAKEAGVFDMRGGAETPPALDKAEAADTSFEKEGIDPESMDLVSL